jgi:diketogulonate reductase-like aldo/keto reductase
MLKSGAILPTCGLGTFKCKGDVCKAVVLEALACGYRLIDTARVYKNEVDIGIAIQQSGVNREEIYITTKIPPTEQGEEAAYSAVLNSLENLRTSYLNLVLIHWPGRAKTPLDSKLNLEARRGTWKALIRAKREGLVRDIGVSNFTVHHLNDACFQAPLDLCAIVDEWCELPAVNQVECHPACLQDEVREYCANQGIVFQAYSSLCCGDQTIYGHTAFIETLEQVRKNSHGKVNTPQELLLLWGIQHNMHIIPKSASPDRVRENWNFMQMALRDGRSLPDLSLRCLDALLLADGNDRHLCWDSSKVA